MSFNSYIPVNLKTDIDFNSMNDFLQSKFKRIFQYINNNNKIHNKLVNYELENNNCYYTLSFNINKTSYSTIFDINLFNVCNPNSPYIIKRNGKKCIIIIQ
jgi:hypothetical protein